MCFFGRSLRRLCRGSGGCGGRSARGEFGSLFCGGGGLYRGNGLGFGGGNAVEVGVAGCPLIGRIPSAVSGTALASRNACALGSGFPDDMHLGAYRAVVKHPFAVPDTHADAAVRHRSAEVVVGIVVEGIDAAVGIVSPLRVGVALCLPVETVNALMILL